MRVGRLGWWSRIISSSRSILPSWYCGPLSPQDLLLNPQNSWAILQNSGLRARVHLLSLVIGRGHGICSLSPASDMKGTVIDTSFPLMTFKKISESGCDLRLFRFCLSYPFTFCLRGFVVTSATRSGSGRLKSSPKAMAPGQKLSRLGSVALVSHRPPIPCGLFPIQRDCCLGDPKQLKHGRKSGMKPVLLTCAAVTYLQPERKY